VGEDGLGRRYQPPLTVTISPVMWADSSLHKKTIVLATSMGSAWRRKGVASRKVS
jgi:hypothetical protein